MKSVGRTATLWLLCLLGACASAPKVVDLGVYNPNEVDESTLVSLEIHRSLIVVSVDDVSVDWKDRDRLVAGIVRMPPGPHVLVLRYNDAFLYTRRPITVIALLEEGKRYVMEPTVDPAGARVDIIDVESNTSAVLDLARLRGETDDVLSSFIKHVLTPTMDEVGHTVQLHNDQYLILLQPDMIYSMTDRRSGETREGRVGFIADFKMSSGSMYFLETDVAAMSREEFLSSSNYEANAQIVAEPIACNQESVTFRFERPDELEGQEILFQIEQLE